MSRISMSIRTNHRINPDHTHSDTVPKTHTNMKNKIQTTLALAAVTTLISWTSPLFGADIVNDTWIDGNRNTPATPTDSENGTDADSDGNIESRWANAGGTMTIADDITPGGNQLLRKTVPAAGSASWTTYFAPDASPVTLANAGDKITITWVFTPKLAVSTGTGNQNLRIAIVDSPNASRVTGDGAPASGAYTGYGIFGNFSQTLVSNPLRLMERVNPSGNFLSTAGEYLQIAAAGTNGNPGYVQNTTYTLVFTAQRTVANALDITVSMSGAGLDTSGAMNIAFTDATPNTFTFDTFGVRPQTGALTSEQFDTSLFKVDLATGCPPGTIYAVTGGGSYCSGGSGVAIGLAGSDINVDYQLKLGGVDVGSPVAGTGAALSFGLQTTAGSYTVQGSNTSTFCVGSMSGNAVITVNTAPSIGTEPTTQNPALGGSASFNVVATGAGLTYQWRRDGTNLSNGGNISGATSATLTVNPVALVDGVPALNGYDVVVSGTCSPAATSTRVALNVAIPDNLTWVGDGVANLWDTSTANWSGDATVFADNDNVTFNAGSASPAVDLVGVISPNTISVAGSQSFTFGTTTSGSLGGLATLTKSGSGTLTLSTVNTFTGKATVNGGTLSITTGSNLGTPPGAFVADQLTLNGGVLQVTASGSINANRGTTLGTSGGTYDIPTGVSFTNSPVITGSGSLTKTGDGALALNVANTYAGNSTVNAGVLEIGNNSALGTGNLILNGGTASFPAARTITNGVSVTENSTLNFGSTGNSAVVLNGTAISGASGKTLTINAPGGSTVAGTRIRVNNGLTNAFTFGSDLVLNGTFTFATYNNQGDQTYNGVISGNGTLGRRSPTAGVSGNTILNGDNTYSGGTVIADGGIGFGISSTGNPTVTSGPIGTGTLSFEHNPNTFKRLSAVGGARTVDNAIAWPTGTNQAMTIEGSNPLTLGGTIDFGAASRVIITSNSATTTLTGALSNGRFTKAGAGTLLLNGTATLSELIVAEGTLGGNGSITGPVSVNSGGTLAPGTSIGALTVTGDLTLAGDTSIEVNKTAGTKDLITGVGTLNYGGTLTVANLSGTLTAGDSFVIASATTPVGNFASIVGSPGAGLAWSFNPATGTLSVISNVGQPTLNTSQSGDTLTFTWTGAFKLQAQTNSLSTGLTGTWFDYPGGGSSPVNTTINPANGSVFYRLINQ